MTSTRDPVSSSPAERPRTSTAGLDATKIAGIDDLHELDEFDAPVLVYEPIVDRGVIVDLRIVHINGSAYSRPLSQNQRVGDLASAIFVHPELSVGAANEAWVNGTAPRYSIRRRGLLGDDLVTVRFDVSTYRMGDLIAQTVEDHTIADRVELTEERYRATLDALTEGVALLSLPASLDRADPGTEALADTVTVVYQNQASLGFGPAGIIPDEVAVVRRVEQSGVSEFCDIESPGSAEPRFLRVAYHPLSGGVVRVIVDRTAERTLLHVAERESDRQREVLDHVMESIGLWSPVRDPDGRLTDLRLEWRNAASTRLSGHRIDLGDPLSDVIDDDEMLARMMTMAAHVLETGEPVERRYSTDEMKHHPITSRSGRIRLCASEDQLVVAILDDSDLVSATEALATSEHRFRTTLEGVTDTVATWVPVRDDLGGIHDFVLRYANPALVSLLPLGTMLSSLVADHDLVALARRAIEQSGPHTVTTTIAAGEDRRIWQLTAVAVGDEVVGTGVELTELVRRNEELGWLAAHDPVSRLLNHTGLIETLQGMTATGGQSFALLWLEASELDMIRHVFGFATADQVVEAAAVHLERLAVAVGGIAARPEDGAFAFVLPMTTTATAVIQQAAAIIEELTRPIDVDGLTLLIGPHGGVVIVPLNGREPSVITKRAKTAAAEARRTGSSLVRWRQEFGADQRSRASLLGEFERALRHGQVTMEYQPKFSAATGAFTGAEALARWRHPERGLIPPSLFIPSVEATALIRPFARWAIETALTAWQGVLEHAPDCRVAVNLPAALIADAGFTDLVVDTFLRTGLHPSQLQVEITERGLGSVVEDVSGGLQVLSELGVAVALDDFGAGQSSLAFLRHLPLHEVKIDQGFVRNLDSDRTNRAIVNGCVGIARSLGLVVCAEGVETREEATAARELGCDLLQGYLLGGPVIIDQLIADISAAT